MTQFVRTSSPPPRILARYGSDCPLTALPIIANMTTLERRPGRGAWCIEACAPLGTEFTDVCEMRLSGPDAQGTITTVNGPYPYAAKHFNARYAKLTARGFEVVQLDQSPESYSLHLKKGQYEVSLAISWRDNTPEFPMPTNDPHIMRYGTEYEFNEARAYNDTTMIEPMPPTLAEVNEAVQTLLGPNTPAPTNGLQLRLGTFTVVRPDNTYRTIRLRQPSEGAFANRIIVDYLSGPDNSLNFTSCAFLEDESFNVTIWRRFTDTTFRQDIKDCVAAVLRDPDAQGELYALRSGRCSRCGRVLTVPVSLHRGLGPRCAAALAG